ncbi:MAG: glycoside hydrolase family 95 protein, partial [Flavitalea sp.]
MRFTAMVIFLSGHLSLLAGAVKDDPAPWKPCYLWYRYPANNWNEALPVGNGRMGAMVFGGVRSERLQLNEQTLWSGGPRNWNNSKAKDYLPLVRDAIFREKYKQADSLTKFMQGPYTESYLPMGDVIINYDNLSDSSAYARTLSLDSALSGVQFSSNGARYMRSVFASYPDKVIVFRNTCTKKGSISFTARLSSPLRYNSQRIAEGHIRLKGKCPSHIEPRYLLSIPDSKAIQYAKDDAGEGMNFDIDLLVRIKSGKIYSDSASITVENADECTFIISGATSYNGYDQSPGLSGTDPVAKAQGYLQGAEKYSYDQLLQRHLSDYHPLFSRFSIDLGESPDKNLSTDERLKRMNSVTDPELVSTIAQYGRYLLIAGSRPGGQPLNLKGIWNDRVRPEYSSNFCIDHDAQMFYYAAETGNLSETHMPFLDFIEGLAHNGRKTAAINYGMRGWCAHHNTDIWRQTGAAGNWGDGNPHWATWNMSGPWLCAHLFDHYLFTGDKSYLRKTAWPVMKGAAEFCRDWLIDNDKGSLMSVPSVSPENTFITERGDTGQVSINSTCDVALIKELYKNCILAMEILHIDSTFLLALKKDIQKLPAYGIGSGGQLLEWSKEWNPVDPSHRHLSHMYPLFPGSEISPVTTPELSAAAKKALSKREKTNCTWGFPLKAACWARTGEGDSAWLSWREQLRYVDSRSASSVNNYGLYPNLFNSDGPDVIMNGNGCATAVIVEMLVQSQAGFIQLLPALPQVFGKGSCRGIVARNGFVVNLDWEDHRLKKASIHSVLGNDCAIVTGKKPVVWYKHKP